MEGTKGWLAALRRVVRKSRTGPVDAERTHLLAEIKAHGADAADVAGAFCDAILEEPSVKPENTRTTIVATLPRSFGPIARNTRSVLLEIVRGATSEIVVVGYEIRDEELIVEVGKAAIKGVRVYFICDKDKGSWQPIRAFWPKLVEEPKIFVNASSASGKGPTLMHGKSMLIDGEKLFISSANMTLGGLERNTEIGVLIEGAAAREARTLYSKLMQSAHLVKISAV